MIIGFGADLCDIRRIADALDVALADLRHAWDHGLARALGIEPSAAESNPNPTAGSPAAGGKAD